MYVRLVSRHCRLDTAYAIRDRQFRNGWALRALLALGAGHLPAGVILFFTDNSADLSVVAKFGVAESAVVIAALAALFVRLDRPVGQALLNCASVFVGALVAVIGQVYQSGADADELLVVWSLLIAPWTLTTRSAAHWFVGCWSSISQPDSIVCRCSRPSPGRIGVARELCSRPNLRGDRPPPFPRLSAQNHL